MTATAADLMVDEFTPAILKQLTSLDDPCVTLLMPTRRDARDLRRLGLQLRALTEQAAERLRALDVDPDDVLAPVTALIDDSRFWTEQADGLAIFADRHTHHVFRLPHSLEPTVQVGAAPHLAPVASAALGDGEFHLLAVSQNKVRLFSGSRSSLREQELGPIPASLQDMERSAGREPELQHQHQPAHRGVTAFHGHGGTDVADQALEKFLLEVAAGARARIGAATTRPVVLASVAEYLPKLRATRQLPTLLDEPLAGNPDALSPADLLARAWPLVQAEVEARQQEAAGRFRAGHGTGTAIGDQAELQRAAAEGRIGTLLVARSDQAVRPGTGPDADDDLIVKAALQTGAELVAVEELPGRAPLGALLRY